MVQTNPHELNRRKLTVCATVAIVALSMVAGCRRANGSAELPRAEVPRRIISLSPGITEIMYGIGAFSALIADSEFCDFPEEAKRLPHVGGFFNANLEAIAALKPDLVILIEDQGVFLEDKLGQLGIGVLIVKSKTVVDIVESIRAIGGATGRQAEGERLAAQVETAVDLRAKQTSALPRPRVLCVIDRLPGTLKDIYVASPNSFIGDLITASGGANVAPLDKHGYARIQGEAIAEYNPQVIIDIIHGAAPAADTTRVWQDFPRIDAVRNGRVTFMSDSVVVHPSQRLVEGLERLSQIIHPEVFGSYGQ
jgi:iron complex transport system substrate-binding protein